MALDTCQQRDESHTKQAPDWDHRPGARISASKLARSQESEMARRDPLMILVDVMTKESSHPITPPVRSILSEKKPITPVPSRPAKLACSLGLLTSLMQVLKWDPRTCSCTFCLHGYVQARQTACPSAAMKECYCTCSHVPLRLHEMLGSASKNPA